MNIQGGGLVNTAYIIQDSDDVSAISQDPNRPLTAEKTTQENYIFHDTAYAPIDFPTDENGALSCGTCYDVAVNVKAGKPKGIGEGRFGFSESGGEHILSQVFQVNAIAGAAAPPDLLPHSSPTIQNAVFQDGVVWNDQFDNSAIGSVDFGRPDSQLAAPDNRYIPLNLDAKKFTELEMSLFKSLYDTDLMRFQPACDSSGSYFIVDTFNRCCLAELNCRKS